MSNPYQGFFDKLDAVIDTLTDNPSKHEADAADLLRRAGFVLGNLLNAQAQLYPHLFIDPEPETVPGEAVQPESDARSAGQDNREPVAPTEDTSGTAPE